MIRDFTTIAAAAAVLIAAVLGVTTHASASNAIATGNWRGDSIWDFSPNGAADANISNGFEVTSTDNNSASDVFLGDNVGAIGTLTITGGALRTDSGVTVRGGILNMSGGVLDIGAIRPGLGFEGLVVGENGSGVGTANISGGTINIPHVFNLGALGNSTGNVTQSAGIVNAEEVHVGNNGVGTYNMLGGQLISSGVLRVGNHSDSTGSLTISGSAVLEAQGGLNVAAEFDDFTRVRGVSGALNIVGSLATIRSGNFNANGGGGPDTSSTSSLAWTIDAGGVSPITVLGAADLDLAVIDLIESVPVSNGTSFELVSATGRIANAGTITLGPNAAGRYVLSVKPAASAPGQILTATRIPEPAALALAGLGSLGLLARRGRRG